MSALFGNLLTAMVTPFSKTGEVDFKKAASLATYLVENGSDGVVLSGTTGESPTLCEEEKEELFHTVASALKGKGKVLAGTGSFCTAQSIRTSKIAEECRVDGLMLVSPYYNKPSQEGIYHHFASVAASTKLPIMLYNVPGRTGSNMSAETTLKLARINNVAAIKEASGNIEQIAKIRANTDRDFSIYSGDDSMTLPILSIGGQGVVSVASHVAGREIKEMIAAFHAGEIEISRRVYLRLLPLFSVIFIASNPVPVKEAMNLLGHDVGEVRPPLVKLNDSQREEVRKVLVALGYL